MSETMTMNAPLTAADGETLKVKLARERRNKQLKAIALVAPLALFLLLTFLVPIAVKLANSDYRLNIMVVKSHGLLADDHRGRLGLGGTCRREAAQQDGHCQRNRPDPHGATTATKRVPRTPMVPVGVFTLTASGLALAIRPET